MLKANSILHNEKGEKTMTNNGQKFLKITSILMIIGGIIAVIAGVIAILGVSARRERRWNWAPLRQFHPFDDHLGD